MSFTTRRDILTTLSASTVVLLAGCSGNTGSTDTSGGNQDVLAETDWSNTADGNSLQIQLNDPTTVSQITLSIPGGDQVATASVDGSEQVELTDFTVKDQAYEIAAVDAEGETIDTIEWSPPSQIVIEDITVRRQDDFRRLTFDLRNEASSAATATDAYVQNGFPLETVSGADERIGSIADLGSEKTLPPGETTTVYMETTAEASVAGEDRLLDPDSECGGDEGTVKQIGAVLEFADQPDKVIKIDLEYGGTYRDFYPYGCEVVNVDKWEMS